MNKGSRLQRFAAWAAAGLVLAPWPAIGQQTFSGATEVVVVEVPVQVVKDGEPVRGLTANDFEIYDGRKKMPVTGFEVLDLTTTTAATGPAAQVPVSGRRHFLMLFDLSNSEPKSIVKARAAAQNVMKGLHPSDLVAVATYDSFKGLQLVLGFTPDRQQLTTAFDTLGLPKLIDRSADPLKLVLAQTQSEIAARQAASGPQPGGGRGADAQAGKDEAMLDTLQTFAGQADRAQRTAQEQQLRSMTKSFADLARLMAEVEGRKYVVLLSEGFDSSLVSGNVGSLDEQQQQNQQRTGGSLDQLAMITDTGSNDKTMGDTRSQNVVEKMLEEFRRADCVIQAVDIGGLRAANDQAAQHVNGKDSLLNMAKSTGGELYENFNDFSTALNQMVHRTSVTYVLSFQPDALKPDGSYHKLKVELKNGAHGARVVYRPGFYAPRPFKEQTALLKALDAASDVLGEETGAIGTAVLAAPFAANGESTWVPVVIEVNGASLLAGKQDPKLPVEIYVYALDQNGSVVDFLTQTVGLDLTKAESLLRPSGLKFFGQLSLPKGSYTLRTLVRNGTTGASSLRVTEVTVPGKGEPVLLPAFFPEAPGRWGVMVRENLKQGQAQMPYPFMLKDQPFIPSSKPVLSPGQEAQLVLQGYNLAAGELKAEAKVLSADGKEVAGGDFKLSGHEGAGPAALRLTASFRPPSLPPGDYQLRVTVTDGAGKAQTSMARFAVGGAAPPRGSL
ncbi:MAG TPA: VWA domain-containing protein [Thermoanaerobaculia bacterium]|nr:VWA domain-containing protein [Thermoanaerobaculia bacterium]